MNSPFALKLTFGAILFIGFVTYYFAVPRLSGIEKDADRFYTVAARGSQLLQALHESPDFKEITFDDCAHIENTGSAPAEFPIVFAPKEGESVKYSSVKDALEHNPGLLRMSENCRKTTVVYMKNIPFKGSVLMDLDVNWKITKVQKPVFSN